MSMTVQELAVLFTLAAGIGLLARILRQPLILAYLTTGVMIGLFYFTPITDNELYRTFAELGVMFLLFLVGLEINLSALRHVGAVAAVIGLGQIGLTFALGFLLTLLLGFGPLSAAYLAVALTLSSTVIVVKLLSEKQDLQSLYGKITISILLLQDVVAIVILLVLAGWRAGHPLSLASIANPVLVGLILFGLMLWLGRSIMPRILDRIGRSPELLFVASLAWVFLVASTVRKLGWSMEMGGFLAGLALANSAEHWQISSRVKPLRDFFLLLFFVVLGSSLAVSSLRELLWPIVLMSLFVLFGTPVIVMVVMGTLGFHRRTSFLTGLSLAQVSEFSFVLAAVGFRLGHLSSTEVTLITAVGVSTIAISSYFMVHADRLYGWVRQRLGWFESAGSHRERVDGGRLSRPVVLIGAHRTGQNILAHLSRREVAIIDFDPAIVKRLRQQGYAAVYGDLADPDLEDFVSLRSAALVISTSPDLDSNLTWLNTVVRARPSRARPRLVVRAETIDEAQQLYRAGADYVFVPTLGTGQWLGHLLSVPAGRDRRLRALRQRDQALYRRLRREWQ
ncbi:MAG: cation:proton antiporter [Candidatus Kerfeldbacteria bacterium]|nr:cation:proton antiporter [Candidatus Kerfeldbacteria bacterium]